jgi:hypothetical protein
MNSITKETVIELESQLVKGIRTSDISILEPLLHDDLLFVTPSGQVITKEMDLESHKKGEMVVDKLTTEIRQISVIGDTAVVVVKYNTKGIMMGEPVEGQFQFIRVWKQFAEGNKVIGGSCSLIND